jgi:hypothetical protein
MKEIYFRRNISAEQQRDAAMISLIANPTQMLYATQTNTVYLINILLLKIR